MFRAFPWTMIREPTPPSFCFPSPPRSRRPLLSYSVKRSILNAHLNDRYLASRTLFQCWTPLFFLKANKGLLMSTSLILPRRPQPPLTSCLFPFRASLVGFAGAFAVCPPGPCAFALLVHRASLGKPVRDFFFLSASSISSQRGLTRFRLIGLLLGGGVVL